MMPRKSGRGGAVLLKKKGSKYFSNLAKNAWKKRKEAMKLYEAQLSKTSVKGVSARAK